MENQETEISIYQPQITDDLRAAIEEIIKEYELNYNINVFFACDTGSRSLGVAVESSDFDLNGFFIPDYREYIKIIRKSHTIISKQGRKFKCGDREYEIDVQLWDVKDWLKEKIEKNNLGCDFWFESPIVYRNLHPEIIQQIRKNTPSPYYYFWGKFKNNFDLCLKDVKKEGTQNKKIMNTLIYATQYLHSRLFKDFPNFNIFKDIDYITANKDKFITNEDTAEKVKKGEFIDKITEEEYFIVTQCFDFIKICFEEKKKGRKSLTKTIPEFASQFIDFLNNKFNAKPLKLTLENKWNTENAQAIFDQLISIYRGK